MLVVYTELQIKNYTVLWKIHLHIILINQIRKDEKNYPVRLLSKNSAPQGFPNSPSLIQGMNCT